MRYGLQACYEISEILQRLIFFLSKHVNYLLIDDDNSTNTEKIYIFNEELYVII